ncbi:MAG: DUF2142 domain-containing protein [Acidimicrobiales bacterium]
MPGRPRSRPRRRVRVPAVVLAASVVFAVLGVLWSVVAPLNEAPDEPAHLGLVLHLADGRPYPDFDQLHSPTSVYRLCRTFAAATRACPQDGEPVTITSTRRHLAGDAPDKSIRPAWNDEGGAKQGGLNQMAQHPPLYYEAMAGVLRVERATFGGPWSLDRELALLRLANVALVAPLPLLAWWAATRAHLSRRVAVLASFGPLALPMVTHIGSTVNNDNLLTLCGAGVVALLAGVAVGDRSLRTAVAVGVVAAIGMLAKASAVTFLPAIVLAYLVGWLVPRDGAARASVGRTAAPAAAAGGLMVAGSAWWYLRVRLRTGRFAPTIEETRLTTALRPPGFHVDISSYAAMLGRGLTQRFWGSFGWYSVRFSTGFAYTLTAVLVALVVVAFFAGRARRGSAHEGAGSTEGKAPSAWLLAVLLSPLVLLGAFVVQRSFLLYQRTSKFQFIQGRYLFPAVTGLAVVVAVAASRLAGRWALPVAAAAVAGMQAWALRRALVGFWGGPGVGPVGQVRALVAWSAWPGEVFALLGLSMVAAISWLGWAGVTEWREP